MAEAAPERPLPAWSLPREQQSPSRCRPSGRAASRVSGAGGSTGKGVKVCILDSGIEADHPDVGARGRRRRSRRATRSRSSTTSKATSAATGRPVRGSSARSQRTASSIASVSSARIHGQRDGAPRRPSLGGRTRLRRDQHEPVDDEEPLRRPAPRGRRPRLLPPDGARRLGAQHAGRELPLAVLVRDLGGQPRGAGGPDLLLQPQPAGGVLRARRRRGGRLARRRRARSTGNSFATPHVGNLRADPRQASRS